MYVLPISQDLLRGQNEILTMKYFKKLKILQKTLSYFNVIKALHPQSHECQLFY